LNCYETCEYCSKNNGSSSENNHNCVSCLSGYLYSYEKPGNCYKYPNLEITEDKKLNGGIFITAECINYKIASTGECIDRCPSTSPYYTYVYNITSEQYEIIYSKPPKYIYNKICYEECPVNTELIENNICICNNAFYNDINNKNIICLPDDNCINEYPYQYKDSKKCYNSLENCDYFFENECYSNCPNGTVAGKNMCVDCLKLGKCTDITPSEIKNNIKQNILSYVNASNIIAGSNFIAAVLSSDDIDHVELFKKGLTSFDLGNCTD
jgi:hypothetical protein